MNGRPRTPGPRGLALWKVLSRLTSTPHQAMLDLATTYGDVVELDFPLERVVFLFNPDDIEDVLHRRYRRLEKQTGRWRTLRQMWGNGLIMSDGDFWRRQRQRMQPAFHQQRVDACMEIFVAEASRLVEVWAEAADRGRPRDVYRDTMDGALRALARAMFGADIERHTDRIIAALDDVHAYVNPASLVNLLNPPPFVRRLLTPGFTRFQRGLAEVDGLLQELVRRRLDAPDAPTDLLGLIMLGRDEDAGQAMSVAELLDELRVVLMAGHETTGIVSAWAWHWLARTPEARAALEQEVDEVLGDRLPTVADLPRLTYTSMVIDETMRLAPPAYAFDRRTMEDEDLAGYRIPRGTTVVLSPYAMHHHPKYWDRPGEFDPLRFSPERSAARPAYAFLPFGGGPRRCIGMRFAQMEMVTLLAVLARRFRVVPLASEVRPRPRLNFAPYPGVPARIERRGAP